MDKSHLTLPAPALPLRSLKNRAKRNRTQPISGLQVKLERVLGLTLNSNAALSCDPENGIIAYPAGCTVVLYSPRKDKQAHLISNSKKPITCLTFSPDGRYLATGETGHQPAVRVWDTQENTQIAEFLGHKFGINCVAFSPNMKHLVSVGTQHDMVVNVWNWKSNAKAASNKVSCKVKAISFSETGAYFVTVGIRHVKFWYLERNKTTSKDTVPLMGRSAILADQRNNYFCDVVCGKGPTAASTFCITQSGLLCEFNSKRLLERWVELRTKQASSLIVSQLHIFVGCAEGIVRVFAAADLHYIATLPRPHYLGVDISAGINVSHVISHPSNARYPDTMALCFEEKFQRVTCVYNDRSLYIWDVSNLQLVGKAASFLYHSSCIWGLDVFPSLTCGEDGMLPSLPPGTFVTCGSDDTIRFWNLDTSISHAASGSSNGIEAPSPGDKQALLNRRNVYSPECLKILYCDQQLQYLCDVDYNPAGQSDKVDTSYDGKNGVRTVRFSHDGCHLASGDRSGNVRVFNLHSMVAELEVEAHDSEVLCLEFSHPEWGSHLLASASRDRLIHVFDVNGGFKFVNTLDEHSSSITAVKFAYYNSNLHLLSCGADKSLIFRQVLKEPNWQFPLENHVVSKATLYDMDVDTSQQWVYTACQDRQIRVYSLNSAKCKRCFKGALSDDGALIKLQLDDSGVYAASSCSDKQVYITDASGKDDCVATLCGHAELVTGLKFTRDFRQIITVSGDGCIFVWRVSSELTNNMLNRLNNMRSSCSMPNLRVDSGRFSAPSETDETDDTGEGNEQLSSPVSSVNESPMSPAVPNTAEQHQSGGAFDVNLNLLPSWARRQIRKIGGAPNGYEESPPPQLEKKPKGKWAERAGSIHLAVTDTAQDARAADGLENEGMGEVFLGPGNGELIAKRFDEERLFQPSPKGSITTIRGGGALNNFGSLANVRLVGGDDAENAVSPQQKAATIYFPGSQELDDREEDKFEVKERSEIIKSSRAYGRSETTVGDMSDDDVDIGTSNPNLLTASLSADRRSLSMSSDELDKQQLQGHMLKSVFENLDKPDDSLSDNCEKNIERGTPIRQSISQRHFRTGSGRLQSLPSAIANGYTNSGNLENGGHNGASVDIAGVATQKAPPFPQAAPSPKIAETPRRSGARWLPAIDNGTGLFGLDSRPSSSTSSLSAATTTTTEHSEEGGFRAPLGYVTSLRNNNPDVERLNRIAQSTEDVQGRSQPYKKAAPPPLFQKFSQQSSLSPLPSYMKMTSRGSGNVDQPTASSSSAIRSWTYKAPSPAHAAPSPKDRTLGQDDDSEQTDDSLIRRARSLSALARDKTRRQSLHSPGFADQDSYDPYVPEYQRRPSAALTSGSLYNNHLRETQNEESPSFTAATRNQLNKTNSTISGAYSGHDTASSRPQMGNLSRFSSRSMGALNQLTPTAEPSVFTGGNSTIKKISDIRDKLKKSSENLAMSPAELERLSRQQQRHANGSASTMSRSKSQGFLNACGADIDSMTPSTKQEQRRKPATDSAGSNLSRSSSLAKSLNSLHMLTKGHAKAGSRVDLDVSGMRRSEEDGELLAAEATDRVSPSGLLPETGSFYDKATTLPRSRRTSSAVQKKAQTARSFKSSHNSLHVDRMSASGDSDSCESSSANGSGTTPVSAVHICGGYRRTSTGSDAPIPARYASPRRIQNRFLEQAAPDITIDLPTPRDQSKAAFLLAQDWERRTVAANQQQTQISPSKLREPGGADHGSTETTRRTSYLAKLLAADNVEAGRSDSPRSMGSDSSRTADDFTNRTNRFGTRSSAEHLSGKVGQDLPDERHYVEKMARHCQESIGEFKTSLDKVLQAYQLVSGDSQLTSKDRDRLIASLTIELEAAYKRLGLTLNIPIGIRTEPEGGHVDEVSSNHNTPISGSTASLRSSNSAQLPPFPLHLGAGQDPTAMLQQYSEILVNMIQQKMAVPKT